MNAIPKTTAEKAIDTAAATTGCGCLLFSTLIWIGLGALGVALLIRIVAG